jgi:hypothetical protein
MLEKDLTREEFARAVGLQKTTAGNVIRGGRCSRATRRKITDFLDVQIWNDMPVQREITFPVGMQFLGLSSSQARADFGSAVVVKGDLVEVVRPILVTATFVEEGIGSERASSLRDGRTIG